jgi:hypothetical protein
MKTVALGPWRGELGWMVAVWVPCMRWYAKTHDRTRIVSVVPIGTEPLVQDFSDEVVKISMKGKPDRWLCDGKKSKPMKNIVADKWYIPDCSKYDPWGRIWRNYADGRKRTYDVCIHARAIHRHKSANRNWPKEHYDLLVQKLRAAHPDISIASIGSPDGAMHIDGTKDMRNQSIHFAIFALSQSRLCLGPSSGPMHLAAHCGTPHLVWTENKRQKSIGNLTNRDRYERLWNPLRTPVKVIDKFGWQPPVDYIHSKAENFLL